jgi:transposase
MARPILDDKPWALIEPLLPPPKPRHSRHPGRKPLDNRAGVNAEHVRASTKGSYVQKKLVSPGQIEAT